ncbi:beta family protein [Rhodococcus sp. (in: high G+C Gram-positive bacteria)]|uniref:beta family protein n=1 Tax=Rhodococcus sp. TaxID=1831 RepID=UPI00338F686E
MEEGRGIGLRNQGHYIPILKGRLGEFNALRRMPPELKDAYTPLIEIAPTGDETNDDGEVTGAGLDGSLAKSIERLGRYWPTSRDCIVDTHGLPDLPEYNAMAKVVEAFAESGNQIIPTIRPSDSADIIDGVSAVLTKYNYRDICLRLAGEDLDDGDEPVDVMIERLLRRLQIEPGDVDVVIDFGSLRDEQSASFAARIARLIIMDLPALDQWKSVTLAAGGFPSALDTVPPEVLTDIPRWELTMWRAVRDRLRGKLRVPSFGDYAIAYPVQATGVAFAPAPQIRYTAGDNWLILKGRKTSRRGSAQFIDICGEIVAHPEFTRGLSWGDEQIEEKARFADVDPLPDEAKPGNAMIWRAIGTSHHLCLVIEKLSTAGEP